MRLPRTGLPLACALVAAACRPTPAPVAARPPVDAVPLPALPDSSPRWDWVGFAYDTDTIPAGVLDQFPADTLGFVRAVVFGRHGRIFADEALDWFLEDQDWYRPDTLFTNARLNDTERYNLDLIRLTEAARHEHVQPGDLRYWQSTLFTPQRLGPHGAVDWRVLVAEVEAIHGRTFPDDAWLQRYFDERYWYHPDSAYADTVLTPLERQNLATIRAQAEAAEGGGVQVGDLAAFSDRVLRPAQLRDATLRTLRLLREEIRIRRGAPSPHAGIAQLFEMDGIYHPRPDWDDSLLTETDRANLAVIRTAETDRRARLLAAGLDPNTLNSEFMFAEDADRWRWSILAAHGAPLEDSLARRWADSLPGYHPDSTYSDARLNESERRAVVALAGFVKEALSEDTEVEG